MKTQELKKQKNLSTHPTDFAAHCMSFMLISLAWQSINKNTKKKKKCNVRNQIKIKSKNVLTYE